MSQIYGILGLEESNRDYVNTIGQSIVFDAIQEQLRIHNEDLERAYSIFVEETTEDFKRRYQLAGGGMMQRRGGRGRVGTTKVTGSWDVAFPLEDFGDEIGGDQVSLAYMRLPDLNLHLDSIMARDINTTRYLMLQAIFNNTDWSFEDQTGKGVLMVKPLANGDDVLYPPVLGSTNETTENHYRKTGYDVASISDTNNPCITAHDELAEHFGESSFGEEIVLFMPNTSKVEELTDFTEVTDRHIRPGDDVDEVYGLPTNLPGTVKGRCNHIWVVEWKQIPQNYGLGIHLEAKKPLVRRVDPADTGLPSTLALVSTNTEYPLQFSTYQRRQGFGVGNRLNGVVFEFGSGGSYAVPSLFARN